MLTMKRSLTASSSLVVRVDKYKEIPNVLLSPQNPKKKQNLLFFVRKQKIYRDILTHVEEWWSVHLHYTTNERFSNHPQTICMLGMQDLHNSSTANRTFTMVIYLPELRLGLKICLIK